MLLSLLQMTASFCYQSISGAFSFFQNLSSHLILLILKYDTVLHCVEMAEIYCQHFLQKLREINNFVTKLHCQLCSRNNFQVRVNFLFYHTVFYIQKKRARASLAKWLLSLFSILLLCWWWFFQCFFYYFVTE